jgi:hypothetical protein
LSSLALVFDLLARDRASAVLKNVGDQAQRTGKLSLGLGGAFKKLAVAVGGLLVFDQVARAVKGFVTSGSDLTETINKSNVIFGTSATGIRKWAANSETAFGLTEQQALSAASSFGDMFTQIGFTQKAAVGMSKTTVQLATDLGSFNNLPTADVQERIAAAFRGEYDSLQKVIPNINAARVEQVALATTGKESAKQLTAQEKAAAVLAIVQKDGARAAGDFARTQGEVANQSKIAKAQLGEVAAKIGTALQPMVKSLFNFLTTTGIPALSRFGDFLGDVFSGKWEKAGAQLKEWGGKVVAWIQNTAAPWIWEKLQVLGAKLEAWIKPRIPGMIAKLQELGNKLTEWITTKGIPLLGEWLGKMGAKFEAWILPRIPGMLAKLVVLGVSITNWLALKLIPALVKALAQLASKLTAGAVTGGKNMIQGLKDGIVTKMQNIGTWITDHVLTPLKNTLKNALTFLKSKGGDLLQGLKDGIIDKMSKIGDWIQTNVGDPIIKAVKSFFGIKSPSTVMAGVGKNLILGLGKGLLSISPLTVIKKVFGGMPQALGAMVDKGLATISSLPGKALKALSGLGGKFAGLFGSFFSGGVPGVTGSGGSGIRALARLLHTSLNHHIDPQGGNAYDIFGSGALNSKIAEALRLNHAKLGLRYVISQMRIASARSGWNWRGYTPITNQGDYRHTGHVHVSYARGTLSAAPGIARLAEKGSELVVGSQLRNMGGGGQRVFNARETAALLSGRSSARPITILIDLGDGLRQQINGFLDERDEFKASVGRTR